MLSSRDKPQKSIFFADSGKKAGRERSPYRLPAPGGGHRMGPSHPCVGPKANGLKQATRIDRNRKARTTAIARRGTKAGLGTDETVSRPRPMMHSLLAVTSACAASCATNQRIAPGRTRTCNTATCAAYRPALRMECYLLHHGGKTGTMVPASEEDTQKNKAWLATRPNSTRLRLRRRLVNVIAHLPIHQPVHLPKSVTGRHGRSIPEPSRTVNSGTGYCPRPFRAYEARERLLLHSR